MKKLLTVMILSVTILTACADEVDAFEKAKVSDAELLVLISKSYCAMPERLRMLNRNIVNSVIAPNSIIITCGIVMQ